MRAAQLAPNNDYIWAHVGIVAYEGQRFAEAEQFLMHSVRVRPNALAFEYLSRLAYAQGNLGAAITYLRSAIELHSDSRFYLRLGDLYAEKGLASSARDAYQHSLILQPDANPASGQLQLLATP